MRPARIRQGGFVGHTVLAKPKLPKALLKHLDFYESLIYYGLRFYAEKTGEALG